MSDEFDELTTQNGGYFSVGEGSNFAIFRHGYSARYGIHTYCARLAILSRWPEDYEITKSLGETLANASFRVNSLMHNYKTPLYCMVYLRSLDVPLEISLTLDGKTSHPISGFPLSITQRYTYDAVHAVPRRLLVSVGAPS